jgi:hypothetical protein
LSWASWPGSVIGSDSAASGRTFAIPLMGPVKVIEPLILLKRVVQMPEGCHSRVMALAWADAGRAGSVAWWFIRSR